VSVRKNTHLPLGQEKFNPAYCFHYFSLFASNTFSGSHQASTIMMYLLSIYFVTPAGGHEESSRDQIPASG
jgi:hypothetical protein